MKINTKNPLTEYPLSETNNPLFTIQNLIEKTRKHNGHVVGLLNDIQNLIKYHEATAEEKIIIISKLIERNEDAIHLYSKSFGS